MLLAGVTLPALAQESLLPEVFGNEQALPPPQEEQSQNKTAPPSASRPRTSAPVQGGLSEVIETQLDGEELLEPFEQIEMPGHAKRDAYNVGVLDPVEVGIGVEPWGGASGKFLSVLMRRMNTPLPSRWTHIALRNALIAKAPAPANLHPIDWVADRAWLLLRMGEADAARMLVAGVDVENFTPRMFQVAVQAGLATADPSALCPLRAGIEQDEPTIAPMTEAMCASLSGEPERASVLIDSVRRRGRVSGADLAVAEKVVGAGGDTRRAVSIEWEPVDRLTAWRFGLANATGVVPPERLMSPAPLRLRAWQARSPLLSAEQRLPYAWTAAGLGVLSSTAMVDLYAAIYDATEPDELGGSDAWRLRIAFAGRDVESRMGAMRHLWSLRKNEIEKQGARAMLAAAAARIQPSADLSDDAPELIASMLAAGLDQPARRWAAAVREMDPVSSDRSWAMLALGAPGVRVDTARLTNFVQRDPSEGKQRSALLLAGLFGLGRIDSDTAARLAERADVVLDQPTHWTRLIDGATQRGQGGTVMILAATGLQAESFATLKPSYLLHAILGLRLTGQEYMARMIAAEALART